jgi:hypothetical protein
VICDAGIAFAARARWNWVAAAGEKRIDLRESRNASRNLTKQKLSAVTMLP